MSSMGYAGYGFGASALTVAVGVVRLLTPGLSTAAAWVLIVLGLALAVWVAYKLRTETKHSGQIRVIFLVLLAASVFNLVTVFTR